MVILCSNLGLPKGIEQQAIFLDSSFLISCYLKQTTGRLISESKLLIILLKLPQKAAMDMTYVRVVKPKTTIATQG